MHVAAVKEQQLEAELSLLAKPSVAQEVTAVTVDEAAAKERRRSKTKSINLDADQPSY